MRRKLRQDAKGIEETPAGIGEAAITVASSVSETDRKDNHLCLKVVISVACIVTGRILMKNQFYTWYGSTFWSAGGTNGVCGKCEPVSNIGNERAKKVSKVRTVHLESAPADDAHHIERNSSHEPLESLPTVSCNSAYSLNGSTRSCLCGN